MGVVFHGLPDKAQMEQMIVATWPPETFGIDNDFMNRILEVQKNSVYILGSPHLPTSLINEHPTLGQNNARLLHLDNEVLPYTEFTVHYGNLLGNPFGVEVDDDTADMSRPKRDRNAPRRFAPAENVKLPRGPYKKKNKPSTQDTVEEEDKEGDSGSDDSSDFMAPAKYIDRYRDEMADYLKSLKPDEIKHILGFSIVANAEEKQIFRKVLKKSQLFRGEQNQ